MEIKDYLRAIRRRLWLPLLIPLVAAMVTGLLVYRQPTQYSAQATVIVPALSGKGYSTSAVTQYFSTYKDVLTSKPVADAVVTKTGAKIAEVEKTTAATVSASSNIINVTCLSTDKNRVAGMCNAQAVQALDAILGPQLARTQDEVQFSQKGVDKANKDITDFQQACGCLLPDKDYALQQSEVAQLVVQLQQAKIANDTARVDSLNSIIADRQKQLSSLSGNVTRFQDLQDNKRTALAVFAKATTDMEQAQSTIASNHAAGSVVTADLGKISKVAPVIRFAGIAYAVALILCLAVIALMELTRPRRERRTVAGTPVLQGPGESALDRTTPVTTAQVAANGNGNGNGNGHAPGGNGHTPATQKDTKPATGVPRKP